jgi:hypothetical protein
MASTNGCFNQDCQVVNIGAGQACNVAIDSLVTLLQFDGTYQVYPAIVSGGLGDYTYNWNNGTGGLTAFYTGGVYAVTITDVTGCSVVTTILCRFVIRLFSEIRLAVEQVQSSIFKTNLLHLPTIFGTLEMAQAAPNAVQYIHICRQVLTRLA